MSEVHYLFVSSDLCHERTYLSVFTRNYLKNMSMFSTYLFSKVSRKFLRCRLWNGLLAEDGYILQWIQLMKYLIILLLSVCQRYSCLPYTDQSEAEATLQTELQGQGQEGGEGCMSMWVLGWVLPTDLTHQGTHTGIPLAKAARVGAIPRTTYSSYVLICLSVLHSLQAVAERLLGGKVSAGR